MSQLPFSMCERFIVFKNIFYLYFQNLFAFMNNFRITNNIQEKSHSGEFYRFGS